MFRASSVPIIRSCPFGTCNFHAGVDASKQSQDGTAYENCQCRMYGRELLMMGREDARNM